MNILFILKFGTKKILIIIAHCFNFFCFFVLLIHVKKKKGNKFENFIQRDICIYDKRLFSFSYSAHDSDC